MLPIVQTQTEIRLSSYGSIEVNFPYMTQGEEGWQVDPENRNYPV